MAIEIAPPKSGLSQTGLSEAGMPEADPPLARQRRHDKRALWRVCGWGGSAAIALAALAMTTQTESGNQRLQLALLLESQPERPAVVAEVAPRAAEPDAQTLALEAQVRALAADRDRLTARIAGLERNLDDVTGSIKRQAALVAESPPSPPPSVQNVRSVPSVLAMPAGGDNAAPWPAATQPQADAVTPVTVPLPPVRVAVAPAAEPPRKPGVGIDLGGAPNLEVLNARWVAVKANFGPQLIGLHPLAAHDRRPGSLDYRLLAGPLPNLAAATQLCARFAAARVTCRPAKFDGEAMASR